MLINLFVITIPLFFWTLTANYFATPKLVLFLLLFVALVGSLIVTILGSHHLPYSRRASNLFLLLIIIATVLNITIQSEGRPEAIAGRATLLFVLPIISYLLTLKHRANHGLFTSFLIVVSLLSLHSLLQLTFLYQLTFLPSFMQNRSFTPTGSFLTTLTLQLAGLAGLIASIRHATFRLRPLYLFLILLTTISSVAIISLMFPGSPLALNLLPFSASWSVALDALKNVRSAAFGVGLANYTSFFSSVKPLALNSTLLWNNLPQSSTSELMTLLTTGGLTLFIPVLLLIISGLKNALSSLSPLGAAFIIIALGFIFTPATSVLYFFLFILLPYLSNVEPDSLPLAPSTRYATVGLILTVSITLLYFATRPVLADYYLRRAQIAFAGNDGKAVYEAHLAAVRSYPQLSSSRLSYADTNLRLASALSQKKDLTEAERNTVSTLIQQSIREAKAATALRPSYSPNWLALGQLYRQLINVATGADQFAITAYAKAVSLDPGNPSLRVDFGGLLFQLSTVAKTDSEKANLVSRARSEFTTAIQLKPDFANAYYNLAKLLESEKDIAGSLQAMKKVASLIPSDSPDYGSVQAAIKTLEQQQLPAPSPNPSVDVSTPSPLPSPLPGGPVDLNENP